MSIHTSFSLEESRLPHLLLNLLAAFDERGLLLGNRLHLAPQRLGVLAKYFGLLAPMLGVVFVEFTLGTIKLGTRLCLAKESISR